MNSSLASWRLPGSGRDSSDSSLKNLEVKGYQEASRAAATSSRLDTGHELFAGEGLISDALDFKRRGDRAEICRCR